MVSEGVKLGKKMLVGVGKDDLSRDLALATGPGLLEALENLVATLFLANQMGRVDALLVREAVDLVEEEILRRLP